MLNIIKIILFDILHLLFIITLSKVCLKQQINLVAYIKFLWYNIVGGEDMNALGAKLKLSRLKEYLTQEELAEKMNVSVTTIQNWENGKTMIKMENIKKLSSLLKISLDTLIKEMILSDNKDVKDNFPYFLFSDGINDIIRTLHLSLEQQELLGTVYIYNNCDAEYINESFEKYLKLLPHQYIDELGSIHIIKLTEGILNVLKYVKADFIIRVLKISPKTEFNICTLSKELICDYLDYSYIPIPVDSMEDSPWFEDFGHYIDMHYAKEILPILNKSPLYIADINKERRFASGLKDDLPEVVLQCRCPHNVNDGIFELTETTIDEGKYILSINDKGKKLLEWFNS